ncbi:MAG: hypothetical protein ABJA82_05600 [Myxococcales bacterium]
MAAGEREAPAAADVPAWWRAFGRSAAAAVAACAAVSLPVACSTTYQPQHTGRVAIGIDHAAAVYVKDGHAVSLGPFSGALEALVAETPAAAAHAHTAHRQFQIGIPAYLVGAGGVIGGVVLLSGPIGWVVIGTGAAALGTGLGFMGAGLTHAIDAMNLHNDAVSAPAR